MRQETTLPNQAITVNGNGQSVGQFDADHRIRKTVQITGTFAGTVTVVGSLDGTNWSPVAGGVTAPSILLIDHALKFISITGSSWTSGVASATMSSFNSRSDPG